MTCATEKDSGVQVEAQMSYSHRWAETSETPEPSKLSYQSCSKEFAECVPESHEPTLMVCSIEWSVCGMSAPLSP